MAEAGDLGGNTGKRAKTKALSVKELEIMARKLRRHIITMIGGAASGHVGGSLSAVEIISSLYGQVMRHDPGNPGWPDRDRFILSKGHAAPALYAVLAECGYFPVEELSTLRGINSRLQGHTDSRKTAGVEMTGGSLGQGLSFGIGMALAGRLNRQPYRVYCLLGDGECDEGQVWEAAMAAAHFKLDNLVAVVDRNDLQIDGWTCDVMELEPFRDKWQAFGWRTMEVNGHDFVELRDAFEQATAGCGQPAGCPQPAVIIAHTVKGRGVSFMENNAAFHGRPPTPEQTAAALEELE